MSLGHQLQRLIGRTDRGRPQTARSAGPGYAAPLTAGYQAGDLGPGGDSSGATGGPIDIGVGRGPFIPGDPIMGAIPADDATECPWGIYP